MRARLLRAFGQGVLELLMPSQAACLGCGDLLGAEEGFLCRACADRLRPIRAVDAPRCLRCGRYLRGKSPCPCEEWPDNAPALSRSVYPYGRPVDGLIHNLKYRGVYRLGPWMGARMADMVIAERMTTPDALVPVPMHPKRLRERGFNQAETLASVLAGHLNVPLRPALLVRTRNTKQQAKRKAEERRGHLTGAFAASPEVQGLKILLVDDVLTTGATAGECALTLLRAGAARVELATFACAMGGGVEGKKSPVRSKKKVKIRLAQPVGLRYNSNRLAVFRSVVASRCQSQAKRPT